MAQQARVWIGIGLALIPPAAFPCAPAPPLGHRVDVLAEQALIVWNPEAQVEHFVRRASFESDAPDFGFLVPTPTRPELAEAPDGVFDALEDAIQPEVVERHGWRLEPTILLLAPFYLTRSRPTTAVPQPAAVRVLEQKRVAGYDAAILQAADAPALVRWLKSHGYASRPELQKWLEPYVEKRWTVTAFKVAGASDQRRVATQAVRMSFASDRPFFPYREPADQRLGASVSRELRVYLVAPGRMDGTIGVDRTWSRELLYAAPRQDLETLLGDAIPSTAGLPAAWLNAFKDLSSPRPGVDDLLFAVAASREPVLPPPIVIDERTGVPLPLDLLAGLPVAWLWWRRRTRARAVRSSS